MKINPEVTIISVGENNNHGHPDEEALKNYKKHSSHEQIFITKDHGTIFVEIENTGNYRIKTENMKRDSRMPTIGKIKIEVTPTPKKNGYYNKEVMLNFKADFAKLPKGQKAKEFTWIVQNNGIEDDGDNHQWYVGQKNSINKYENMTKYTGIHVLLCKVVNQRGNIIATKAIEVKID